MYIFLASLPDAGILFVWMLALYAVAAFFSVLIYRNHRLCNILSNSLSCSASVLGFLSSLKFLFGTQDILKIMRLPSNIPYMSVELSLDRLSAFFILALSLLAFCVSLFSIGYISHYYGKRNVGLFNFLYNLFICSIVLVFTARSFIFFLIAWELMSLVSYFLVIFEQEHPENQRAGILYLIMTHIGTAFMILAFALIYRFTGSMDITVALQGATPFIKNILFVFFLLGFGTKAGIVPLHVWLPYAHPAAPSNISALMSGIMIKTAIYGLLRFVLGTLGAEYGWWGTTLLIIGAFSTILGVAYAFMEKNIKRLLAYSSIENIGIILIGLGISFSAYSAGNKPLSALSLLAALIHLFNHSLFKGLMFLGAGSIHFAAHTKDMEKLGGLIKKMPFTGLFFLAGSLSIAAIPPFNGFVGEWLTYQALFADLLNAPASLKLVAILAVAALAMGGALAAASLIKAFGISFLALPRTEEAGNAREVPRSMLAGMGILSLLCLVFGLIPALSVGLVNKVSLSLLGVSSLNIVSCSSCFVYFPLEVQGNTISPLYIFILLILLLFLVINLTGIAGAKSRERKYGTWDCGFIGLNSRMQYSATGFSKPLRIVFRGLYRPSRELQVEEGPSPYYHKSMRYTVSTQPIFEKYLYQPITAFFTGFSKKFRMYVQTGSIHTYLIYMFITILALLVYNGLN